MNTPSRFRLIAGALCALLFVALSSQLSANDSARPVPLAITKPMPLEEAVRHVDEKTPVASRLSSAEWRDVAIGIKERGFFSSKVEDIRIVGSMQAGVKEALDLSSRDAGRAFADRDRFIADMREKLGAAPGDSGSLTDLTSSRRLGLVYDFNVEDAMEAGRFKIAQDPELLDAFPAQELIRIESRETERPWLQIWKDAGGIVYPGDRMIARKDDRVWYNISDFGRPWAPFKFGSGMGTEDVDRDEAVALKVLGENDVVKPQDVDFNAKLQASVADLKPEQRASLADIFGDQLKFSGDSAQWQGNLLTDFYERAAAGLQSRAGLDLGAATELTGEAFAGQRLQLSTGAMRSIIDTSPAFAQGDTRMLPWVWRQPDAVKVAGRKATLEKYDYGRTWQLDVGRITARSPWTVTGFSFSTQDANWPRA